MSTRSAAPSTSVVRSWSSRATPAGAEQYLTHFRNGVLPALRRLAGHRGALVLRRPVGAEVEITVLTLWASLASVHEFAGPDPTLAVVEPEARTVLTAFDERATHYELALYAEA